MICLHLACAAEPVSPFLPEDNEDRSPLCLVIGRGLHCWFPPDPHHDLIAFLCSNNPFHIPSPVSECLTWSPGAASATQLGGFSLACGCWYLERPGNPPERWADSPPSAARPRDAWGTTSAPRICFGSQSETEAFPNPAPDSAASLPVTSIEIYPKGIQTYKIKHMAAQTHSRGEKRHPDVCLVIQA